MLRQLTGIAEQRTFDFASGSGRTGKPGAVAILVGFEDAGKQILASSLWGNDGSGVDEAMELAEPLLRSVYSFKRPARLPRVTLSSLDIEARGQKLQLNLGL
jgi:DNA polymerase-4